MWLLEGTGETVRAGDGIVRAGGVCRFTAQERLDDANRFGQPLHPRAAGCEGQTQLAVVTFGGWPPCPEAQFEPAARQKVEGGALPGEQNRVTEVVGEDVGAHAQGRRGAGRGSERGSGARVWPRVSGIRNVA